MMHFWEKIDPLDQKILLFIQRIRSQPLNIIFKTLTYSATGPVWWSAAIALNVLSFKGMYLLPQQTSVQRAFYGPLLTWFLGAILKRAMARVRPSENIEGYKRLMEAPGCASFPSTHAASSFAFYIAFQWINHPFAFAVGVWSLLVSFSRLYLGVHYLSDIIGGVFLGLFCTSVFILLGVF